MAGEIISSITDVASNVVPQLASAISQSIPPEVFLWIKVLIIVIIMYFVILIIKNLIQAGTALRIRKISKSVDIIKNDVGVIAHHYNQQ